MVEIDLVRQYNEHIVIAERDLFQNSPPYKASVWRATIPDKVGAYPIRHSQRLPRIIVPLRDGDDDVVVDLQKAINETYRRGRYADLINYRRKPHLPIDDELDQARLNKILREKGYLEDT